MRAGLLLGMLAAAALAACAEAPPQPAASAPPPASVASTRWVGVADDSTDPRMLPRLEFLPGGRLAGFTGCNLLSGAWTMEGDAVRLSALAATKRFCVGAPGEVEKRFLSALTESSRGHREGGRLVFVAPGGARIELREAAAT